MFFLSLLLYTERKLIENGISIKGKAESYNESCLLYVSEVLDFESKAEERKDENKKCIGSTFQSRFTFGLLVDQCIHIIFCHCLLFVVNQKTLYLVFRRFLYFKKKKKKKTIQVWYGWLKEKEKKFCLAPLLSGCVSTFAVKKKKTSNRKDAFRVIHSVHYSRHLLLGPISTIRGRNNILFLPSPSLLRLTLPKCLTFKNISAQKRLDIRRFSYASRTLGCRAQICAFNFLFWLNNLSGQ